MGNSPDTLNHLTTGPDKINYLKTKFGLEFINTSEPMVKRLIAEILKGLKYNDKRPLPEFPLKDTGPLPEFPLKDTGPLPEFPLKDTGPLPELPLKDTGPLPGFPTKIL